MPLIYARRAITAFLVLLAVPLPSPAAVFPEFSESSVEKADWTVAVYVAGDNDLEKFALLDLQEMESGLSGSVNVIALIDRAEGYDASHGDWTNARVYRVTPDRDKNRIDSTLIAETGELNMGDPDVLAAFLERTLRAFPARRNALVLWDHGGGWALHATDHAAPGTSDGVDHLTLPELSRGIRDALSAVDVAKLDLIGFDMCLMAQLETAYELAPVTEVLVASQATEPGDGWPYDTVLGAFADTSSSTSAIASRIVDVFDDFYRARNESITTLSAYDLQHLPLFGKRLSTLLDRLDDSILEQWPDISRSMYFAEGYAARTDLQRTKNALASVDVMDLLRRMQTNADRFPAAELGSLESAHRKLVINSKVSAMRRLSSGLAIYAPVSASVFNDAEYAQLAINSQSEWPKFLRSLHAQQTKSARAPVLGEFQLVDWKAEREIDSAKPLNTHGVQYVVDGQNLLALTGLKGVWDESREGINVVHRAGIVDANWSVRARETAADRFDLLVPKFKDGKNVIVTDTPGYRYLVADGSGSAFYATIDESGATGDHITVPVVFHHPDSGDVDGTIYFHPEWWYAVAVELQIVQPNGNSVLRQIKPSASDEFTLLFEYLGRDGTRGYKRGERVRWNNGPELILNLDPPGDYVFGVVAETIGGHASHATFDYRMADDPDLAEFIRKGSTFESDDLLGVWEMVEPQAFVEGGALNPTGALLEYRKHPEKSHLLLSELTAPSKNPDFADRDVVFLDTRGLNHTRSFKAETVGVPENPHPVEFSVDLVNLYIRDGTPIMVRRNMISGLTYVFAKQSGAGGYAGAQSPGAEPGDGAPGGTPIASLDGIWQRDDGVVLVVQGRQFEISQFGMTMDGGYFMMQDGFLTTQSVVSGEVERYRLEFRGNDLVFHDEWGGAFVYRRLP